jgi:hypothetical protein
MPVIARGVTNVGGRMVRRRIVDSSNVSWVGWPLSGEPVMLVKFRGGEIYAYLGVSRQRAVAAAHAASTGRYIARRIKPQFKVMKIT